MISASSPRSRKYSPIAQQPAYGAMYCIGGRFGCAAAATMIVWSIAPCSSSLRTTPAIDEVLLADGDVDTLNAGALLVDDRIDRHRALAGLAVADDQLALTATDRHHRVDRTSGRSAPAGRPTWRSDDYPVPLSSTGELGGFDNRALAVDRVAERVDNAAQQALRRPGLREYDPSS